MTTKLDPTRTTMIRRRFMAEMRKRFYDLRQRIREAVDDADIFGLRGEQPLRLNTAVLNATPPPSFAFKTSQAKVEGFRKWLQEQIDQDILSVNTPGPPWTAKYVDSAYRKGSIRAFIDTRKLAAKDGTEFFDGSKEEFLRQSFAQPERLSKIRLLATRTFESLRGVTQQMSASISRVLADGLARGDNPRKIAREMSKTITGITRRRALTIARTEVIHAHAEGQLDSFEDLGVKELGILAEWSTAGDDRVCARCANMEGAILTVEEARGLIPLHPNCRCAWIPTSKKERQRQRQNLIKAASGGTLPKGASDAVISKSLSISKTEAQRMVLTAKDAATKMMGEQVAAGEVRSIMTPVLKKVAEKGGSSAARIKHYTELVKAKIRESRVFQAMHGWYKSEGVGGMLLRGTATVSKKAMNAYVQTINTGLKITGYGLPAPVRAAGYLTGMSTSYVLTPWMPWLAIPGATDAFSMSTLLAVQVPYRTYLATRWMGRKLPLKAIGRLVKGSPAAGASGAEVSGVVARNLSRALERLAQRGEALKGTVQGLHRATKQSAIEAFQERAKKLAAGGT